MDSLYSSHKEDDTFNSKYKRTKSIDFGQTKKSSVVSYKLPTIIAQSSSSSLRKKDSDNDSVFSLGYTIPEIKINNMSVMKLDKLKVKSRVFLPKEPLTFEK